MKLRSTFFLPSFSLLLASTVLLGAAESANNPKGEAILAALKEGNARFVANQSVHPGTTLERRAKLAKDGQAPAVTILSCSDSREVPEIIFDQGIGDLFIIRVAGNIAGPSELASVEYGTGHLHTPVLLVMGHTKCGAVTAAVKKAELHGALPELVAHITPAVEDAKKDSPEDLVAASIEQNVWHTIADLITKSEEIRDLARMGKLTVVGGIYNIETGNVRWLGTHARMKELLAAEGKAEAAEHAEEKAAEKIEKAKGETKAEEKPAAHAETKATAEEKPAAAHH